MPRSLAITFVLLVMPALSAADPAPKAGGESPVYYPTTVGTKWVMRYGKADGPPSPTTYTVTAVEEKGGAKIVTVSSSYTIDWNQVFRVVGEESKPRVETVEGRERYRVSPEGLSHVETYDREAKKWVKAEGADRVARWPGQPGEKSTGEIPEANYRAVGIYGKPEQITVAAGTFEAIPEYVEITQDGRKLPKCTYWRAAGIGTIKSVIGDESGAELISFSPAKK